MNGSKVSSAGYEQYHIDPRQDGRPEDISADDIYASFFPAGRGMVATKDAVAFFFSVLRREKIVQEKGQIISSPDDVVDGWLKELCTKAGDDIDKKSKLVAIRNELAKKRVAVFGDSITAHDQGYVDKLERMFPELHFGKFGVVNDSVARIEARFLAKDLANYRQVIILGGVNSVSIGLPARRITAGLQGMYTQAKKLGARVIAIPILPWGAYSTCTAEKMIITRQVNDFILNQAKDVDAVVKEMPEKMADPQAPEKMNTKYTLDGLHPLVSSTPEDGHEVMARTIAPYIKKIE